MPNLHLVSQLLSKNYPIEPSVLIFRPWFPALASQRRATSPLSDCGTQSQQCGGIKTTHDIGALATTADTNRQPNGKLLFPQSNTVQEETHRNCTPPRDRAKGISRNTWDSSPNNNRDPTEHCSSRGPQGKRALEQSSNVLPRIKTLQSQTFTSSRQLRSTTIPKHCTRTAAHPALLPSSTTRTLSQHSRQGTLAPSSSKRSLRRRLPSAASQGLHIPAVAKHSPATIRQILQEFLVDQHPFQQLGYTRISTRAVTAHSQRMSTWSPTHCEDTALLATAWNGPVSQEASRQRDSQT